MISAFNYFLVESLRLTLLSIRALRQYPAPWWKRLLIFVPGMFLYLLLQTIHWLAFLVDELLFRNYRMVRVNQPVFITGIPRSGTTFLQRTLADDGSFTTTTLWECVLAPSITERLVYRSLGRLLLGCSQWFKSILGLDIDSSWLSSSNRPFATIHELGMNEPEEDFLLLLPVHSCLLLFLLFPRDQKIWALANFNQGFPDKHKQILIHYYYRMVQKHLYFHGADKCYLSKNPSFTSWVHDLTHEFTGAKIIFCDREPTSTVASQMSSLLPASKLLGHTQLTQCLKDNLLKMLRRYYEIRMAFDNKPLADIDLMFVHNDALRSRLADTLNVLYRFINRPMSADFSHGISARSNTSKEFQSEHSYSLEDFGLTNEEISAYFHDVWAAGQS